MKLKPVDFDPFAESTVQPDATTRTAPTQGKPRLRPVEHDPFAGTQQTKAKQPKLRPVNFNPFEPTAGAGKAIGAAVESTPDVFKQNVGGLMRLAGERSEQDFARERAMTPEQRAERGKLVDAGTTNMGFVAETPNVPAEGAKNWLSEKGKAIADEARKAIQENMPNLEPGTPSYYLYHGTTSVGQMAPAVIGTILSGNPAVGAALFAPMLAGTIYDEARREGRTVDQATMDSTVKSAAESLSEMLPLGMLTKRGGRYLWRVGKSGLAEGIQEVVNEGFNMLYDYGVIGEKTPPEQIKRHLLDAFVIGAGVGSTFGVPAHMLTREPGQETPDAGEIPPPDETPPPSGIHATPEQSIEDALEEDADLTGGDASTIQTEQDLAETETGIVEDASLTGEDALAEQVESEFGEELAEQSTAEVVPIEGEEIVMEGPAPEPPLQDVLERQAETERGLTPAERQRTIQALEQELEPAPAETPISAPQAPQEAGKAVQPESQLGQSETEYIETPGRPDVKIPRQMVPAAELQTDAKTYQYKEGADTEGITDRLKGVQKWDDVKAGRVVVHELEDGSRYVADGHQRLALAKKLESEGHPQINLDAIVLREADGFSVEDAKIMGAAKNMAEGTGTAWDAARIFRDSDADTIAESLPPNSAVVRDGKRLAALSDEATQAAINADVDPAYAGIAAQRFSDSTEQMAAIKALVRYNPATQGQAHALMADLAEAGVKVDQSDLFGGVDDSVMQARMRLIDRVQSRVRKDRAIMNGLVRNQKTIEGAARNVIDQEGSQAAKAEAEAIARFLQHISTNQELNSYVTEQAKKVASGEVKAGEAAEQVLERARASLGRTEGRTAARQEEQQDLLGGQDDTALKVRQEREKVAESQRSAPPMHEGAGDLFSDRSKQQDVEDVAKKSAKESWEMTALEYTQSRVPEASKASPHMRSQHKVEVKAAIGRGEEVPDHVLAEYPDLQEPSPQSDLIGQYVRSGSATGKVTAISDDGKKATLDTGRRVPVGRAPNWAVQSEPFEGAKKRAAKAKKKAAKKTKTRETDQGTAMFSVDTESDAFQRWFQNSAVVDENGEPLVVYHGSVTQGTPSRQGIVAFEPERLGSYTGAASAEQGFFFAKSPRVADSYAARQAESTVLGGPEQRIRLAENHLEAWEDGTNSAEAVFDPDENGWIVSVTERDPQFGDEFSYTEDHVFESEADARTEAEAVTNRETEKASAEVERAQQAAEERKAEETRRAGAVVYPVYLSIQDPLVHDFQGGTYADQSFSELIETAKDEGNDGVLLKNVMDSHPVGGQPEVSDVWIAFEPTQIKSANNIGTFSPTDPNILRSETAAQPRGMSVAEARQQLESRFGKRAIRKLEKSGRFTILNNPGRLDTRVRSRLFGENTTASPAGLHDPKTGKSWLFTDHISSGDAVGVFLHEVGAHYGLKRMIGAKEYRNVKQRLRDLANQGDKRVREAIFRVPEDTADEYFWDEVLAYLVQHNYRFKDIPSANRAALKDPLVRALRKVVAQIRAFLNQLGFLNTKNLTSDDIVALVQGAARHAVRTAPKSGVQASQEATAMSSAPADTFYSQMARALNDKLPNKGTAQSYAKQIRNLAKKGQFKQDELEWSGVLEWLDNFKQTPSRSERLDEEVLGIEAKRSKVVTKAEVLDFLRANQIRVEEVTKQSTSPYNFTSAEEWQAAIERAEAQGNFDEAERINRAWEGLDEETGSTTGQPKFANYQLPGGENYRELLLTLPNSSARERQKTLQREYDETESPHRNEDLIRRLKEANAEVERTDFRGSHFDEPNVLAHVRFNERRSFDGAKKKRERPKSNNFVSSVIAADLPFNVMQSGVVRLMHHDEVRAAVVASIPTDVVDVLKTLKLPPEGLFSDKAVQADFARAPLRDRLNVLLGAATALGNTQARLAAKLRDLLSAGLDQEILPTLRASDLDRGEVRRLLAPTAVNESTETSANGAQLPGARTGTTLRNTASGGTELSAADRARIADRFTHASLGAPSGPSSNLIGVGKVGSSASLTSLLDSHKRIIAERERTDADGNRTLFIEEIQSDLHQAGRKKGYRSDVKMAELRRRHEEVVQQRAEETTDTGAYRRLHEEEMSLIDEMNALHDAVPNAPFKTTWPLLAMKRMIRFAAENGFSSVAWTTGEQQAARYDLSKHLMEVRLMKENLDSPYTNLIGVEKSGGKPGIDKMLGKDDSLEDYVGKEIAERLDSLEWKRDPSVSGRAYVKRLTGLDLKVGGQGMISFYDKMLPSALNKYVKKWGSRTTTTRINVREPHEWRVVQEEEADVLGAGRWRVVDENGRDLHVPPTFYESRQQAEASLPDTKQTEQQVPALPITDQMREAVMEQGQPLFSKGGKLTPEQKRERLRRLGLDFENLPGDLEGSQARATEPVDQGPDVLSPEEALEELEKQGFDKPMLSVDDDGGEGTLNDPAQQERAQRSLTGNRVTDSTEKDEYGLIIDDPRVDPFYSELFGRGKLYGFFESATDKLRRTGNPIMERLAARVDAYYDRNEARMGWVNGKVRPILKRIPLGKKKTIMRDFEEYWRHHDNGREQEASEVLNRSPIVRQLVTEVKGLYSEMGDLNQSVGVKVYDSSLNEGKGGWRAIGKVPKGKFWPRSFSPKVQRVLANPKNDPELWRQMVDALIEEGHIETPPEASKYLRRYMGREVANDYFSGIEKARQRKLPEMFYDYSWDEFNRYARKWSSRVTQIEQFGQKTNQNTEDLFETVVNSTMDHHTQNYVAALSDHVYSRRSTDIYTTLLQHLNLIATGTQLGNPATATLNFLGGTTLNVQMFGWRRVAKSYATMMQDWKKIQQTGVDLGILGKDVLNILRDTEQSAATYMDASGRVQDSLARFAAFTMKWGGYKGTENIIRMNAMMASWIQLQDALQQWNRNPKGSTSMKYRAFMQRNRIDSDKLLAENGKGPETARYLRMMVNIPQGSYRPDMVPLYVDSPVGRFLFKYQKFGTQVSRMFWQNHLQPFVKTVAGGEKVLLPGQKLQKKTGNIIDEKTGKVVKSNRVRTFLPLLRYFAAALVGGSAILAARSFLFNYNDPGPEWDDLAAALDDEDEGEDRSLMWAMIFDRAYYSLFAASAAGFFGNYIQFLFDFADQQRVKNPLDPPGLASINAVQELVMRAVEQEGNLTARDLDNIGERTLALYRGYKRAGTKAMAMSGSGWKEARLRDAYTDLVYTKKMTRRFADEMDMKGRRTFSGRWGKTPMSPYNQQAYEALLLGDPESARATYKQARQEMEDPGKVAQSMKSSMRARHPWNVGASQAKANHAKFLQWAEKHTSKANYQRILEIGRRYDKARQGAGL